MQLGTDLKLVSLLVSVLSNNIFFLVVLARFHHCLVTGENVEQGHEILDAVVHLRITTFDTTDAYSGGRSEKDIHWKLTKKS